jgi:hypothetical protein
MNGRNLLVVYTNGLATRCLEHNLDLPGGLQDISPHSLIPRQKYLGNPCICLQWPAHNVLGKMASRKALGEVNECEYERYDLMILVSE